MRLVFKRPTRVLEKEIDFVLVHEKKGLLAIEVKGGVLSRTNGQWYSTDRHGASHLLDRCPFAQASEGMHRLKEKLNGTPGWQQAWYAGGHGVIFPHCSARGIQLGADGHHKLLLDETGLDQVEEFIDKLYELNGAAPGGLLREGGMCAEAARFVHDLIAPTFHLTAPMVLRQIREGEGQVRELTESQFRILDFIADKRRACITGGAGTGKSVLAMEKADRLARQGFRTLFVCFNRNLASYFRDTLDGERDGLTIRTFHHLCSEYSEQHGGGLRPESEVPAEEKKGYYEREHHEALLRALDTPGSPRFDALVVDEGQDIHDDWWLPLVMTLAIPDEDLLYVFHDDNQGIFRDPPAFLRELPLAGVLHHNFRNARPIHDLLERRFNRGMTSLGPQEAPPVRFIPLEGSMKIRTAVTRVLKELLEEGIAPGDIAVLTCRSLARSEIGNDDHIGGVPASSDLDDGKRVLRATVQSFKGLDSPVVILTELESQHRRGYEETLYVGLSRARQLLIVIGQEETLQWVRQETHP